MAHPRQDPVNTRNIGILPPRRALQCARVETPVCDRLLEHPDLYLKGVERSLPGERRA